MKMDAVCLQVSSQKLYVMMRNLPDTFQCVSNNKVLSPVVTDLLSSALPLDDAAR